MYRYLLCIVQLFGPKKHRLSRARKKQQIKTHAVLHISCRTVTWKKHKFRPIQKQLRNVTFGDLRPPETVVPANQVFIRTSKCAFMHQRHQVWFANQASKTVDPKLSSTSKTCSPRLWCPLLRPRTLNTRAVKLDQSIGSGFEFYIAVSTTCIKRLRACFFL